jgi:hypothetical protein
MTWTREKPTEAGWYWNRISGAVGIALITRRDGRLYAWLKFKDAWLTREGWLDYIHGEWLGPLSPTDRQQGRVAGLEEAKNICEKLYDSAKDRNAEYYCALLDVGFELAQQARKGGVGDGN